MDAFKSYATLHVALRSNRTRDMDCLWRRRAGTRDVAEQWVLRLEVLQRLTPKQAGNLRRAACGTAALEQRSLLERSIEVCEIRAALRPSNSL
jgi:hypothetical protein